MKNTFDTLIKLYEEAIIRISKRKSLTIDWTRYKSKYILDEEYHCIICNAIYFTCSKCPLQYQPLITSSCLKHPTFISYIVYEKPILIKKIKERIKYLKTIRETL